MRKSLIFLTIIILLRTVAFSSGFMESRRQWWEIRLQKLSAEQARLEKNPAMDGRVTALLQDEIRRAHDIIAAFERQTNNDGALTHITRVMTEADIAAEARTVVPPLCALRQLEHLVREPHSAASAAAAREAVERRLNSMVRSHFGADSRELVKRIMSEDIGRNEWKILAVEVQAGSCMSGRRQFEEQAMKEITAAVSARLSEKNRTANGKELRMITARAAAEYLRGCDTQYRSGDGADLLASSWTWRRIESLLVRDFAGYKKILALLGNPPGTDLERIRHYHRNPAELEPILFRPRPGDMKNEPVPDAVRAGRKGAALIMEIPAVTKELPVLEEMGRLRKAALLSVTGREERKYFNDLDENMSAMIKRRTESAKNVFFREEERVRLIGEKEGARPALSNESEFREARRIFNSRLASLNECRTRSVGLITMATEGKQMRGDEIVARYRYRLQRNREYLQFIRDLTTAGARSSGAGDSLEQKRFALCMNGISSLFRFIGSTLGADKSDRPCLSKGEIGVIRGLTAEFTGSIQSLRGDIRNSYAHYCRSRSSAAGVEKKTGEGLKEKIAQDDIDAQRAHAADCVALHEKFGYGEDVIGRYAERYIVFLKEARTGAVSPELEYAVKMNSLLPSFQNFDGGRIHRELAAKQYLRTAAKTALSRLQTLLQFYRKNGVRIADAPAQEEMAALEKRLGPAPQARIDSWIMNESNISEIDAKAARKLAMMINRKELTRDKKTAVDACPQSGSTRTITIKDPDLSFAVPRGWEEETVGQTESYMGIVKSFSPGNGGPSIKLVRLPMENEDMKDAAENWVRKSGCSLVEKRWEQGPETEYLWIIAKDGDKNISETCSVSRDGFTVLITGKTTRGQYPAFKARLRKIIDSIN